MHWYPLFGAADNGYIGREILDSMRSAKSHGRMSGPRPPLESRRSVGALSGRSPCAKGVCVCVCVLPGRPL